jgi:hypothetical protein
MLRQTDLVTRETTAVFGAAIARKATEMQVCLPQRIADDGPSLLGVKQGVLCFNRNVTPLFQ